jgi:hypothetical protein
MACEAFDSETLHILGNAMDQAWRRSKTQSVEWQRLRRAHDPCLTHFRYGQKRRAKPQRLIDTP